MSSLAKSSIIYTIGNVLPQIIGFVFLPIYSRSMSVEDFGIVSSMEVLTSILTIVMSMSLERAAQRLYFVDGIDKKELLSTLYISSISFGLLCLAILHMSRYYLEGVFESISYSPYIVLCLLTTFINVFSLLPSIHYQLSNNPGRFIAFKLSKFILQIGLIIYFVVYSGDGALGQLYSLLMASLVFLPISIYIAFRSFGFGFNFSLLREGINYSWPFIPTLLIAWILNMSDRIFLEQYVGVYEVGIYSMAYKVSTVFLVITGSFSTAFTPYFHGKAEMGEEIKSKLKKNIDSAIFGYIALFFSACFISREVVYFFLSDEYYQSSGLLVILLLSHLLSSIMSISSVLYILQSNNSKLNLKISILSALVNLFFNFLFIPDFGMFGAAFATLLSIVFLTITQYNFSKKCFFISIEWNKCILLVVLSLVLFFLFDYVIFKSTSLASLGLKFLLLMVLFFVLINKYYGFSKVIMWFK